MSCSKRTPTTSLINVAIRIEVLTLALIPSCFSSHWPARAALASIKHGTSNFIASEPRMLLLLSSGIADVSSCAAHELRGPRKEAGRCSLNTWRSCRIVKQKHCQSSLDTPPTSNMFATSSNTPRTANITRTRPTEWLRHRPSIHHIPHECQLAAWRMEFVLRRIQTPCSMGFVVR
jgi:hypothetical protein